MPEHVHVHAPHELTEPSEATSNREKRLELFAVLIMSIATLGIAWSGYQAARWSGHQAALFTEAGAQRSLANRSETDADALRTQDLLNFNRWLELSTSGNTELADFYVRRFRPEFLPAFRAWQAEDPIDNPRAVASPLMHREYILQGSVTAERLERKADRLFERGREATENADRYVFATVFFAAVLFFAGMSLRFRWNLMRVIVLSLGGVLLAYGMVMVATQPFH